MPVPTPSRYPGRSRFQMRIRGQGFKWLRHDHASCGFPRRPGRRSDCDISICRGFDSRAVRVRAWHRTPAPFHDNLSLPAFAAPAGINGLTM